MLCEILLRTGICWVCAVIGLDALSSDFQSDWTARPIRLDALSSDWTRCHVGFALSSDFWTRRSTHIFLIFSLMVVFSGCFTCYDMD